MNKHFLLCLLAVLAAHFSLRAATVSQQAAQTIALNYFTVNHPGSHGALSATLKFTKTETDGTVDFYVFDIVPAKGFVIVAADDNIIPILAHSDEGYFNADISRIGLAHWVAKTSKNIYKAIQLHILADARINGLWTAYRNGQKPASPKSTGVSPLVTTTWNQENDVTNPPPYLYNLLCPLNTQAQQHCLTGCVATAQAQIMKYWNYPATGTGQFSYNDERGNGYSHNYGTQSSNFAAHTYPWALMPSVLTGDEPVAQDSAVDLLMYDCGVSVGMDYGDDNQGGSGANGLLANELQEGGDSDCSQTALVNYFSYNADSIKGVFESSYSAVAWTALIENEINAGRVVMYEGDDRFQGGHCWVCDGYDADNNLHMNWGWSGFDNGYFAINNLTTTGDFDPIEDDDALIGIVPQYPLAPITDFLANYTSICSGTVQFMDISQDVPTSWAWNFGDNTTSTLQSPSHTYTVSGTYTVTLTATNPAGSTVKAITNYITINLLSPPTVSNVSSVEPASFSLTANTTDSVNWFDRQGNLLSTDNPFVTPVLNTTTTYYVQNSVANPSYHVGAVCHAPAKGAYLTDPNALRFNVLKPCIIESVYMNSKTSANRTVQVTDTMGDVVAQQTVYCPAGGAQAEVNLGINTGGSYYMSVADTLGLFSDTTGANYPYTDSGGIVSITGLDSALYSNYPRAYFYFYNWVVKEPDCVSQRVPLVASILSTGISQVSAGISFTLYPNPAANDVVLQINQTANSTVYIVKNILGQTLLSGNIEAIQTHIDLSAFANGVYLIELNQGEQTAVKKLVVNR